MRRNNISQIFSLINEIYQTRIDGTVWFQIFDRKSGKPINSLSNVRPNKNIHNITQHSKSILEYAEKILNAISVIGDVAEELIIVGEFNRLFLFPLNNLVIVLLGSEKIGDVCFHTLWEEHNKKIGIKPILKTLEQYELNYKNTYTSDYLLETNVKYDIKFEYVDKINSLLSSFDKVKIALYCNDELKNYNYVAKSDYYNIDFEVVLNLLYLFRQKIRSIKNLIDDEFQPIGDIKEVIIGREGFRENNLIGGSIIISGLIDKKAPYLMTVSNEPIGLILLKTRSFFHCNENEISTIEESDSTCFSEATYYDVFQNFYFTQSKIRKRQFCQLAYDTEKLIINTTFSNSSINSLEIPDVTSALIENAKILNSYICHITGKLLRVEIATKTDYNNSRTEKINLLCGSISEQLTFVIVSNELIDIVRKETCIFQKKLDHLSSNFDSKNRLSLTFHNDDMGSTSEKPFLLLREKVNLSTTPYQSISREELLLPRTDDREIYFFDPIDELYGAIQSFIDRARILMEFIFKVTDEPWSLSLVGSLGIVYCCIRPSRDHHTFLIGIAQGRQLSVEKWVKNFEMNDSKNFVKLFLSYAQPDEDEVSKYYHKFIDCGYRPWMAKENILPGQIWKNRIEKNLKHSDFIIIFLSEKAVKHRGFYKSEIKSAIKYLKEKLEDDIFLIPVKLDDCEIPEELSDIQCVNIYEPDGWERLLLAINEGTKR